MPFKNTGNWYIACNLASMEPPWSSECEHVTSKSKVNILLYSDPYHWTRSALHCWQLVGKTNVCSVYGAVGSPAYYSLAPQVHERTFCVIV